MISIDFIYIFTYDIYSLGHGLAAMDLTDRHGVVFVALAARVGDILH
jgi:hypothetical protein